MAKITRESEAGLESIQEKISNMQENLIVRLRQNDVSVEEFTTEMDDLTQHSESISRLNRFQ